MSLFSIIYPDATPEELARYEAVVAEIRDHAGQRPCPSGCGCAEFYDDRNPDEATGGFGIAGCTCDRCNGTDDPSTDKAEDTPWTESDGDDSWLT